MLRNLKVGTKLFVILLAPVLVIVSLVAIGVRDRRATAADAQRVEDVGSFVLVANDLQTQLEAEQLRTAMVSASRGAVGTEDLAAQRARTDAALARYQDAAAGFDTGAADSEIGVNLRAVDSALDNLGATRRSFDQPDTEPYSVSLIYGQAIAPLIRANAVLAGEANDRDLLRGLDAASRIQQLQAELVDESTLAIGAAQRGAFTDDDGSACASTGANCGSFDRYRQAAEGLSRAQESLAISGATNEQKQAITTASGLSAWQSAVSRLVEQAESPETPNQIALAGADMLGASLGALDDVSAGGTAVLQQVVDDARTQEQQASRSATLYLFAGAVGLAIAFGIAVVVARSITRPLSRLTRAAGRLSTEQLPALVQHLRSPEDEQVEAVAESLTPIQVDSQDEIGELAAAFNSIQAVTVDVAEEQGRLLRKGIGDIFVNLARRNQSLLDRQIEFIDHLESNERDPDQLDNLFKLDHLATRMRRNAESLLVMAGADPPRRRGAPVPVSDVVRVAIGEVEDYQRVHLLALDEATVAANVAADLAHLLSELMENATNASPPSTSVEVLGGYDAQNGYVITVADRGIGMSETQLADANHHLAHPPMVGLVISRSLGLTVVGRLAARYGLAVQLAARDEGGIVATVALPYGLVEYPGEDVEPAPSAIEVMAAAGGRSTRPRRAGRNGASATSAASPVEDAPAPVVPSVVGPPTAAGLPRRGGAPSGPAPTAEPVPGPPVEAPPAPSPVPAGLVGGGAATTAGGLPSRAPTTPPPGADRPAAEPVAAGPPAAAPPSVVGSAPISPAATQPAPTLTAAGLVRRTPTERPSVVDAGPARPAVTRTSRSPEEVRRMLSRYRSGLDRGRTGGPDDPAGAAPPTGDDAGPSTPPPPHGSEERP